MRCLAGYENDYPLLAVNDDGRAAIFTSPHVALFEDDSDVGWVHTERYSHQPFDLNEWSIGHQISMTNNTQHTDYPNLKCFRNNTRRIVLFLLPNRGVLLTDWADHKIGEFRMDWKEDEFIDLNTNFRLKLWNENCRLHSTVIGES